jgi:minor histocompatibility antigen H13
MAGYILLAGLFFYDIFFVFGTNVMVTVAVSMDVPIKVKVTNTLTSDNGPKGILLPRTY